MAEVTFPIHAQIGVFNDESDIDRWMLSDRFHPVDYFAFIKHLPYIFTPFVVEMLRRYKLLKEYNIYSYGQDFDKQPAWWIDLLVYMDEELQKAVKEHGKFNH